MVLKFARPTHSPFARRETIVRSGTPPLTNITEDKQGFLGGVVEVSQGGASYTSRENNVKAIEIKTKLKRN